MSSNTIIWQEEHGKPAFRFQTENENIQYFFSQCKELILVGWGINFNLWIYLGEFDSFSKAQDILKRALDEKHQRS
jgi:hypothetical protein